MQWGMQPGKVVLLNETLQPTVVQAKKTISGRSDAISDAVLYRQEAQTVQRMVSVQCTWSREDRAGL